MAFDSWAMTQDNPEFLEPGRAAGLRGISAIRRRVVQEAQTNHTWARYAPSAPRVAGNLQVNVAAAKTAKLALS